MPLFFSRSLFVPFLKEVYTEVFELIEVMWSSTLFLHGFIVAHRRCLFVLQYPTSNVRKAAVTNVSRLCCSFHKCLVTSGATDLSGTYERTVLHMYSIYILYIVHAVANIFL